MVRKEIKEEADAEKVYQASVKGEGKAADAAITRARKRLAELEAMPSDDPRWVAEVAEWKAWLAEHGT